VRTYGSGSYAAPAIVLAVTVAVVLSGCAGSEVVLPKGGSISSVSRGAPSTPSPADSGPTARNSQFGRPSKLLVVVLENHSASNALEGMPVLAAAAHRYGRATQSFGLTHPSLPNYLAIAGGSTFGVRDDNLPVAHPLAGSSVFGQVLAAGKVAKTYAEGMTTACQVRSSGRYAVKHNPWLYFTMPVERAGCRRYDVPAGTPTNGALHRDIVAGTLPTFSLLIPDLCNDAHDCSLSAADSWLHGWLGQLLAGQEFRTGQLAVAVTFDEDHRDANNNILTAVLHKGLQGEVVSNRLDHYALSRAVSRLVGARPLRDAAGAPDLLSAFGLGGG
jgi:hypothetical protein